MATRTVAIVAGIDEAGRGALAGPVVAAACVLPTRKNFPVIIADSKQMTALEREASYKWLTVNCGHGIGIVDAKTIDAVGILAATEQAMQQAVAVLAQSVQPTYLLVDGCDKFWFDYPHSSIIRGDQAEPCIAAASIIAKVARDRMMCEYHKEFLLYEFDRHKGYGTPDHREAIVKHGPCALHRETYLTKPFED